MPVGWHGLFGAIGGTCFKDGVNLHAQTCVQLLITGGREVKEIAAIGRNKYSVLAGQNACGIENGDVIGCQRHDVTIDRINGRCNSV